MKTPSSLQFRYEILVVKANDWIKDHNARFELQNKSERISGTSRLTALFLIEEFKKSFKRKKIVDGNSFETSCSRIARNLLIDESTVKRHLKKLKKHGFISKLETSSSSKGGNKMVIELSEWMTEEMKGYSSSPGTSS